MPVMRAPGAGTVVNGSAIADWRAPRATVELILIAPTWRRVLASGESRAGQVS